MLFKSMMGSIALATVVIAGPAAAQQSFDAGTYPPFAGQWQRVGPLGVFDTTKPPGFDAVCASLDMEAAKMIADALNASPVACFRQEKADV